MQTISVDVPTTSDLERLLQLFKELGLNWKNIETQPQKTTPATTEISPEERRRLFLENYPKLSDEEVAYHQNIISMGGHMTKEELNEMLKWHEESRNDRPLPYRT